MLDPVEIINWLQRWLNLVDRKLIVSITYFSLTSSEEENFLRDSLLSFLLFNLYDYGKYVYCCCFYIR